MYCEQVRQTLFTKNVPRRHCEQIIADPVSLVAAQVVQNVIVSEHGVQVLPLSLR